MLILASAAGSASFLFFYTERLTLAYGDAASHLNFARRVVDSLTPGLAQLGGIWLPLPHILMLPFALIDPLWSSGAAGAIVSMCCYVATSWLLYQSLVEITGKKVSGLVGALAYISNPSMLYFQSTAMTEPLAIATYVASVYFLIRWAGSLTPKYLHAAGLFVFMASLSRYDGWFMIPAVSACVMAIGLQRRGSSFAEGATLAFLSLGMYGTALWIYYNWMIFGNPLSFAFEAGSAAWYAQQFAASAHVSPRGDLLLSVQTYGWAMVDVLGWLYVGALLAGLLSSVRRHLLEPRFIPVYLFLGPALFNVVSLYSGQSIMASAHLPPFYTWYNVRYGLMALPAAAFFSGYLASGERWKAAILLVAIALQTALFWPVQSIPVILEPMQNARTVESMHRLADELRARYDGHEVLASALANDALIFHLGLPLKKVIYEGNKPYWPESLEHPARYAAWIIVDTNGSRDMLYSVLRSNPEFTSNFDLVYEDGDYRLYRNRLPVRPVP